MHRLVAVLACLAPCLATAATVFMGDVTGTVTGATSAEFTFDGGARVRVQIAAPETVRVRFAPLGTFTSRQSGAIVATPQRGGVQVTDTADDTRLRAGWVLAIVQKRPFRLTLLRPDTTTVTDDAAGALGWDPATGQVFGRKAAPLDERYFGFGLRGGPIDRRGRTFLMKNQDLGGYGEFSDPLYSATPFFYGMRQQRAWGLFLDNPATPFFDLDSVAGGAVTFGAARGELDYYVFAGRAPADIARAFGRLTGNSPLPPKWTLGYHQSRFGYASAAEYLDLANTFRSLAIPCDALYFDIDYLDRLRAFTWNPAAHPDPPALLSALHARGFRNIVSTQAVIRTDDPLWPTLDASGFLLRNSTGASVLRTIFYGEVGWFDFTRAAARTWYADTLKSFMSPGIDALWNDLNEPAANSMDEALYDFDGEGRTDLEARNLYALQETALASRAQLERAPGTRPWILSRSGYPGIQRYAANWSGDTLTSWDSLRVNIQTSVSMGLSGQQQFGHDVGGFLGTPSAELFTRWLQFASLTTYLRTHSLHTVPPREPWRFGEPYTTINRAVIEQRYRWLPYLYSLHEAASRTGEPVLAPTFFHFPADPGTYTQDTEYMLGPWLLVAPVFVQGATTRAIYLPAGAEWIDVATGTRHAGGQQITIAAPLERIPVLVRAGAIIPGGPVMQHVAEPVSPDLELDLLPGPATHFTMYEDDGTSFEYRQGMFLRTRIDRSDNPQRTLVSLIRLGGGRWVPPARSWWMRFHGTASPPRAVRRGTQPLSPAASEAALRAASSGWYHRAADGMLFVKVPDAAAVYVTVVR